jgi:hypothetical protein
MLRRVTPHVDRRHRDVDDGLSLQSTGSRLTSLKLSAWISH